MKFSRVEQQTKQSFNLVCVQLQQITLLLNVNYYIITLKEPVILVAKYYAALTLRESYGI